MLRCLRIFGAYSFRLSRRHSTVLLIASFIVTITVVLQLYAYRHQYHFHAQPRIGDYDYRPGVFLRGQQPSENTSYCEFNYGLPYTFNMSSIRIYPSPESGIYRVIFNAIRGKAYTNYSKYDAVTYATHATPQFVYHIIEIARYWDGPISLSVYVPDLDLDITMQILNLLCHCYPGMSKVSVHLFFPKLFPPKLRTKQQMAVTTEIPTTTPNVTIEERQQKKLDNYRNLDNKTRAKYIESVRRNKIIRMMLNISPKRSFGPTLRFEDCSGPELNNNMLTFRQDYNMIYPINVGRNVARNASKTNYFIVSDIEMVPSDGLAPKFLTMVRQLMGDKKRDEGCVFAKTIFVVPLFEVKRGEEIPRDKHTLVRMVEANRAEYFHQRICPHCQRFPGLQSWLRRPSPSVVEPMLIAKREYPYHRWEPLYFGTHKDPWYSEMLSWEGRQDKMTQMLEMCHQEYRMVVLDGAFLCHSAAKTKSNYGRARRFNEKIYKKIINAFKQKYPERFQCRLK